MAYAMSMDREVKIMFKISFFIKEECYPSPRLLSARANERNLSIGFWRF